jgi:quinol monooxygenase YgiN
MIIRCVTGRFDPAQFAALRSFAQEQLAPTMRSLPGFCSYTAGFDRASGHFLAANVWETEEQAQAADAAAAPLRAEFAALYEAGSTPPDQAEGALPRYFEVIAQA